MTISMKRITATIVLLTLTVVMAFAYGGGGVFQGTQAAFPGYTNMTTSAEIHGGYGYGASRSGQRTGGFGLWLSEQNTGDFLGAFGGVISGRQLRTGPFTMSLNAWGGVGYATPELVQVPAGVAFLAEANAEVGFAVLPWLQISIYGGYQAIGPFDPATVFTDTRYVPVFGSRVTWGDF